MALNKEMEKVVHTDSIVLEVIKEFGDRAQVGFKKYGTDMDRTDLSVSEWAQHLREELMDGLVYLTRLKKDITKLEEELNALKNDTKAENEVKFYDGAEIVTYKYVTQPSKKPLSE
jgi:transcriptional regulator with PAS, ATPase and Fis domain